MHIRFRLYAQLQQCWNAQQNNKTSIRIIIDDCTYYHTRNIFWPRHVFAGICKILRDSPKNTKIVPPLLKKLSINIDRIN